MPDAIDAEIMPAMIEAGIEAADKIVGEAVSAYYGRSYTQEHLASAALDVYRAMRKAKLRLTDYPDSPSEA